MLKHYITNKTLVDTLSFQVQLTWQRSCSESKRYVAMRVKTTRIWSSARAFLGLWSVVVVSKYGYKRDRRQHASYTGSAGCIICRHCLPLVTPVNVRSNQSIDQRSWCQHTSL